MEDEQYIDRGWGSRLVDGGQWIGGGWAVDWWRVGSGLVEDGQ